jgi:hypothetical protein
MLDVYGKIYCIQRALEEENRAVSGKTDNSSIVFLNGRRKDFQMKPVKRTQRGDLITA